jgi:hypothetical protein
VATKLLSEPVVIEAATIHQLRNGAAERIINAEINAALKDLYDRGSEDAKPRKVKIELEMFLKDDIVLTNVSAQFTPLPRRTKSTVGRLKCDDKGKLTCLFQSENAENPDQGTFSNEDGEVENE